MKFNHPQKILQDHTLETTLVVMFCFLSWQAPGFLSVDNFLNVLRNITMQGIIALGMTMVIISGEIDLSVGSAVALSACVVAVVTGKLSGLGEIASVAIGIVCALGVGALTGFISGKIREKSKVPTFITTLAFLTVLSGAANLLTNGFPVLTFPEWYGFLGSGYIIGIPFAVYIFALVFVTIYFLMDHTTLGRSVYAVGGNMEAARLSGIKIWKVKTIALAITSGLAALSGILVSSQIMAGNATSAKGWEMDVIASVVIGGASVSGGGKGKITGTLIGIIFLGFMSNGMTLLNLSEYIQMVVKGGVILGAVLINTMMEQRGVSK